MSVIGGHQVARSTKAARHLLGNYIARYTATAIAFCCTHTYVRHTTHVCAIDCIYIYINIIIHKVVLLYVFNSWYLNCSINSAPHTFTQVPYDTPLCVGTPPPTRQLATGDSGPASVRIYVYVRIRITNNMESRCDIVTRNDYVYMSIDALRALKF